MLDKEMCKLCGVDEVDEFLVDYVDDIDDQLGLETELSKRAALLEKKELVNKLRQYYSDIKKEQH